MVIKVLDCTLRDGAYVVEGKFGAERICGIKKALSQAGVDILECGWLRDISSDCDSVFYNQPDELLHKSQNTALMFDYGKFDVDKLNVNNGFSDIIRIAFYKKDMDKISFVAETLKNKGYKVFLQASNTKEYNEQDLEKLCKRSNFIGVDAVYIVDTFGSMFFEDLDRILPVYNEIVDKNIFIGFHSHNNIQLSFALTIKFISSLERDIIIDSSLCGLGRGAGNLQTELLLEYLNKQGAKYKTDYIKQGINNYIKPLYSEYFWGYNSESAYRGLAGMHPNSD